MRVVVLGGGGIGSVVAAHLARAGEEVTLVTRGPHLDAIANRGLEVRGLASFTAHPVVAPTAGGPCDLLVVATKTQDSAEALAAVGSLSPAVAVSFQNGVLKEETLSVAVGSGPVIGATTMLGASRLEPGLVEYSLDGVTVLGELDGAVTPRVEGVASILEAAGLSSLVVPDVLAHEWSKQAIQAAVATLSVLTDLPCHLVWQTRPLAESVVAIIAEVGRVAAALGIELTSYEGYGFDVRAVASEPFEAAVRRIVERGDRLFAAGKTDVVISMLQDVRARRRTEIEETAGHVAREAERLGVPAPNLVFACNVVRGVEIALGLREGAN